MAIVRKEGKNATVKLGTDTVSSQSTWNMAIETDMITSQVFGEDWDLNHVGNQRWSGSFDGLCISGDTTGQDVLQNAAVSGTKITTLRLYEDATYYWTPDTVTNSDAGCYISNYNTTAAQGDLVKVSFTITGHGPVYKTS